MSVREGERDRLATELCPNDLGDEGPTLLGSLCQSRYRLALPTIGKSGVADYVDVGQVRDGEIGLNLDAARRVGFCIEPFRGGGFRGARSPQYRSLIDAPVIHHDAVGILQKNLAFGEHFDAD